MGNQPAKTEMYIITSLAIFSVLCLTASSFSPFTAGLLSGNGQNSLNKPQPHVLETQLNTLDHAAGKRAPMRFGKRAPMRFGKRGDSEFLNDYNEYGYEDY